MVKLFSKMSRKKINPFKDSIIVGFGNFLIIILKAHSPKDFQNYLLYKN
jgi:hypothetical protein